MSEHTPTTENVRQTFAYVQAGLDDDDGYPFVTHIHVETFDRWLAEVERAAAEKALLEAACSPQASAFDTAIDLTRVRGPLFVSVKTWLTRTAAQYRRNEGEKP